MDGFEVKRLEKRLIKFIYGDESDDASGLSLMALRADKASGNSLYDSEYQSRKAKFSGLLWEYQACFYSDDEVISEAAITELLKLIEFLWLNFIPEPEKEYCLRYIRTSIKRILNRNLDREGSDKNNYKKIKKWKSLFESVRPDLIFDIQNNLHQEFLAEYLLEEYLSRHECKDVIKKKKFILKKIKEAARLDRLSVESIDYSDPASSSSKIDKEEVLLANSSSPGREEEEYKALFDKIQEKYSKSQDREGKGTKAYLSALITVFLIREKNKNKSLDVLYFDLMKNYDFCDQVLLQELRKNFDNGTKFPKQKDIAARFVRPATGNERKGDDASRYLRPYKLIVQGN